MNGPAIEAESGKSMLAYPLSLCCRSNFEISDFALYRLVTLFFDVDNIAIIQTFTMTVTAKDDEFCRAYDSYCGLKPLNCETF